MAGQEMLAIVLVIVNVVAFGFAIFHAIGVSLNQRKPETQTSMAMWFSVPELFLKDPGDHHLKRLVVWVLILVPCGLAFAILVT